MERVKQQFTNAVKQRVLTQFKGLKQRLFEFAQLQITAEVPQDVIAAVQAVVQKMSQCHMNDLHPPYMPKTLTKYRHQGFLHLKKNCHSKINSQNQKEFEQGIKILSAFIGHLDCQHFQNWLQQTRSPYIRKIFSENYEFDQIDFKTVNTQYKIKTQIEEVLNCASEWLIQIQRAQDLLDRIQLYFDIQTPTISQKIKKEGFQAKQRANRTWAESFMSVFRSLASFTLRKSSKLVQNSLLTSAAPAMAMLTLAIIGGTATLPWKTGIDIKLLIGPMMAAIIPYGLDNLAKTVQKNQTLSKLSECAVALEQIAASIAKFNEEIQSTIMMCCSSETPQAYAEHKLNLEKYVLSLSHSIHSVTQFKQQQFQEMRQRSQAYFRKYKQVQQGQWTVVVPEEQNAK